MSLSKKMDNFKSKMLQFQLQDIKVSSNKEVSSIEEID